MPNAMRRAAALALLVAAGCSRCGARSAASAEELLPAHPGAAVITAPLGALAGHAAALATRVAALPGGEQVAEARKTISTQLGFDPFTREGLLAAGVDPDRGAAVALDWEAGRRGSWTLAVPLAKPDQFLQTFDRLARERAGYPTRTDEPRGGVAVAVYARGEQRLAVAVVRGYGVVARGADPAAAVAGAAERKPSLAQDPSLAAAKQKLGAQDLVMVAPQGSPLPQRVLGRALPGDAGLSLQGAPSGLVARGYLALPAGDAAAAQATLPGGGADLVSLLPANAPLRARLGLSPQKLYDQLAAQPQLADVFARLQAAMQGVSLRDELFAALKPGAALSLGLAEGANLAAAIDYGLDFRRHSPFDTVQLVALAHVEDKPRLLNALAAVQQALPRLGAEVQRSGDDFQIRYAGGRGARFGVRGDLAYVLGGPLPPERLAPQDAPEAALLREEAGAAARIDFGKLAAAVRSLPESAYGSGPQAYVTRSLVSQVIEPLGALRVTLGAQATKDGLGGDLQLELAAP